MMAIYNKKVISESKPIKDGWVYFEDHDVGMAYHIRVHQTKGQGTWDAIKSLKGKPANPGHLEVLKAAFVIYYNRTDKDQPFAKKEIMDAINTIFTNRKKPITESNLARPMSELVRWNVLMVQAKYQGRYYYVLDKDKAKKLIDGYKFGEFNKK